MSSLFPPFSVEPRFLAVITTRDREVIELLQRDFAATIVVSVGGSQQTPASNPGKTAPDTSRTTGERSGLTPRQFQILHLLNEGLTNKEIGRALQLSHFTVRNHVTCIFKAVGLHNRRELHNPDAQDHNR